MDHKNLFNLTVLLQSGYFTRCFRIFKLCLISHRQVREIVLGGMVLRALYFGLGALPVVSGGGTEAFATP